jgi:hypothetical protein
MSTEAATTAGATPGQEAYEEEHVHSVYEQIASHFSSTRYKVGNSIMFPKCFFFLLLDPSIHPSIHQFNQTYHHQKSSSLYSQKCKKKGKEKGKKTEETTKTTNSFPHLPSLTLKSPLFSLFLFYTHTDFQIQTHQFLKNFKETRTK